MSSKLFMLDTNTVSYIIKNQHTSIKQHMLDVSMSQLCISAITMAELLRGVAKKPEAKNLAEAVNQFLLRVETLDWDSEAAISYAQLRTDCEKEGKSLGAMDMLIAAHSVAVGAVLVTNDKAFYNVEHHLLLEDWSKPTFN